MKVINDNADYEKALARISTLMDLEYMLSYEEIEFLDLCEAVEKYEDIHYPIDPPSKEAAIQFRKEQEAIE